MCSGPFDVLSVIDGKGVKHGKKDTEKTRSL